VVYTGKILKKLKKSDRDIVNNVMRSAFAEINIQNQTDNIAAFAALKNQGIKFIKPSIEQLSEWKSIAIKANQRLVNNGHNSKKMFNLIKKHIADYRKQ